MRRRGVIGALAAAVLARPAAGQVPQQGAMRRIGMLTSWDENDPEGVRRVAALREGLARLGWVEGRTLRIDIVYSGSDPGRMRALAAELIGGAPDLLLGNTTPTLRALQQQTRAIPIVFAGVSDPVGDGFVTSMTRPGGNITGFLSFDPPIAGKWLELLKEVGPALAHADELIVNLAAARGLGIALPPALVARADEVIE